MTRPDSILDGLNEAQREAAAITTGPVLILAGAGTGKTRVISHRVAFAVASGVVRPSDVLLVTFTEKAAKEMVERVAAPGPAARSPPARSIPRRSPSSATSGPPATTGRHCRRSCPTSTAWSRPSPGGCRAATSGPRPRTSSMRSSGPEPSDPRLNATRPRPAIARRRSRSSSSSASSGTTSGRQAPPGRHRLRRHAHADRRAARVGRGRRRARSASATPGSAWTNTRTPTRSSSACWTCGWAIGATCASWATRTRPSTRSRARRPST